MAVVVDLPRVRDAVAQYLEHPLCDREPPVGAEHEAEAVDARSEVLDELLEEEEAAVGGVRGFLFPLRVAVLRRLLARVLARVAVGAPVQPLLLLWAPRFLAAAPLEE